MYSTTHNKPLVSLSNTTLFVVTLLCALLSHVWGIYLLQGLSIKKPASRGTIKERRGALSHRSRKTSNKRRNDNIATLFHHLESGQKMHNSDALFFTPLSNHETIKTPPNLTEEFELRDSFHSFEQKLLEQTSLPMESSPLSIDLFHPSHNSLSILQAPTERDFSTRELIGDVSLPSFSFPSEEAVDVALLLPSLEESLPVATVDSSPAHDAINKPILQSNPLQNTFNINCCHYPDPQGYGYFFRITLTVPQPALFQKIKQNFFFLIDRSRSMGKKRFTTTKKALERCLSFFPETDAFNILFFDDSIKKMSENFLPFTQENIAKAKRFLKEQSYGSFFSSTDLYTSLTQILPKEVDENEIHTVLLFSDGDPTMTDDRRKEMIKEWTLANGGKVSLFSFSNSHNDQVNLLKTLAKCNKGDLIALPQNYSIGQKMRNFISKTHYPIAKNLSLYPLALQENHVILLYPSATHLPHLYGNIPYTIVGKTDQLVDFTLFLQGQCYNQWVDIKQPILLSQSTPGTEQIMKEWLLHSAYHHYNRFLYHDDEHALKEATIVFSKLNQPSPFE